MRDQSLAAIVAAAPPLTEDQRGRLSMLLTAEQGRRLAVALPPVARRPRRTEAVAA